MTAQPRKLPTLERNNAKKDPHELVQRKQIKKKHRAKHAKRNQHSKILLVDATVRYPKTKVGK